MNATAPVQTYMCMHIPLQRWLQQDMCEWWTETKQTNKNWGVIVFFIFMCFHVFLFFDWKCFWSKFSGKTTDFRHEAIHKFMQYLMQCHFLKCVSSVILPVNTDIPILMEVQASWLIWVNLNIRSLCSFLSFRERTATDDTRRFPPFGSIYTRSFAQAGWRQQHPEAHWSTRCFGYEKQTSRPGSDLEVSVFKAQTLFFERQTNFSLSSLREAFMKHWSCPPFEA